MISLVSMETGLGSPLRFLIDFIIMPTKGGKGGEETEREDTRNDI